MTETLKGNGKIGIRREDKNIWERRVPLTPTHVKELVSRGIEVLIQPSPTRVFKDKEFEEAGATVTEDLTPAHTILCVKEVPIDLLIPNRTYVFFSHTIKAQSGNMPLLDALLAKNVRLIDYECIRAMDTDKRLVRFGAFAGYAGMVDLLSGWGRRMLAQGFSTPFLHLGMSYMYNTVDDAKAALRKLGEEIAQHGLPGELTPLVFAFTGANGAVGGGALEMFECLPHKYVPIDYLPILTSNPDLVDPHVVYGVKITSADYCKHVDPAAEYSREEFYEHPRRYRSNFHTTVAPYASVIVHCAYWTSQMPRILTEHEAAHLHKTGNLRLRAVADITADHKGSVEMTREITNIDHPYFVLDLDRDEVSHEWVDAPGVLFMSIDNLPCEFPMGASMHFSNMLIDYVEKLAHSDGNTAPEVATDMPPEMARAVITCNGALTKRFEYIDYLRKVNEDRVRKFLVIGSGMVAGPAVRYLDRDENVHVVVASNLLAEAQALAGDSQSIYATELDLMHDTSDKLDALVKQAHVVISLVPSFMHVPVAKACIRHKKHLVTASYVSEEMAALDAEAKAAGVAILGECGLDPGIDHMAAMKTIDEVGEAGGKVTSFISWCGGLPAPEHSHNPLHYKFSWSPVGVLRASQAAATWLWENKTHKVSGPGLLASAAPLQIFPGYSLEGLPNRNSLVYVDQYKLAGVSTMFRGTLRYTGFCDLMDAFKKVGLFDDDAATAEHVLAGRPGLTWLGVLARLVDTSAAAPSDAQVAAWGLTGTSTPDDKLAGALLLKLGLTGDEDARRAARIVRGFVKLGLMSDEAVPAEGATVQACFCTMLQEKLAYAAGERDLVLLQHIFGVENADGTTETRKSTLIAYGEPATESAMALTVGLTVAISAKLVGDGGVAARGVLRPLTKEIYEPVLKALHAEGVDVKETVEKFPVPPVGPVPEQVE